MASKAAHKRLSKEAMMMSKEAPPLCLARPREDNILEWHFILRGAPDTPYEGGEYWGQLLFPSDYPFKPPGIKMSTPSGRFKPDTKICTSMSDFHPGTWNPAWSVSNIVVGLLSFMSADEMTTGSVRASDDERRALARASHKWNASQKRFATLFPEYAGVAQKDLPNMGGSAAGGSTTSANAQRTLPAPVPAARRVTKSSDSDSGAATATPAAPATAAPHAPHAPHVPHAPTQTASSWRTAADALARYPHKLALALALVVCLVASRLLTGSSSGGSS